MRRKTTVMAAAVLAVAAVAGGVAAGPGRDGAEPSARVTPASTAKVEQGALSAMVSQDGILTYRARADGSPYSVVNHADGTYTELPDGGDKVGCRGVLYRVDDRPVVLLCGAVPAYRELSAGAAGTDVRQLNRNLRVSGSTFTAETGAALQRLQRRTGSRVTGALALGDAVFLPEPVRIGKVTGVLGGAARPGAPVLNATSDKLHVQVALDPSQQGEVERGDRARITLPGNTLVPGRVEGFGRVARVAAGPDSKAAGATIPTYIGLDDVARARGLDQAPVGVNITTDGVQDALSVPVTALVGRSGGGFAVEVVRPGARRELVAVTLGLFDTGGGRVQVAGDVHAGDRVVVPSL